MHRRTCVQFAISIVIGSLLGLSACQPQSVVVVPTLMVLPSETPAPDPTTSPAPTQDIVATRIAESEATSAVLLATVNSFQTQAAITPAQTSAPTLTITPSPQPTVQATETSEPSMRYALRDIYLYHCFARSCVPFRSVEQGQPLMTSGEQWLDDRVWIRVDWEGEPAFVLSTEVTEQGTSQVLVVATPSSQVHVIPPTSVYSYADSSAQGDCPQSEVDRWLYDLQPDLMPSPGEAIEQLQGNISVLSSLSLPPCLERTRQVVIDLTLATIEMKRAFEAGDTTAGLLISQRASEILDDMVTVFLEDVIHRGN